MPKSRFICPKHGCCCNIIFNRSGGGRFHSCNICYNAGDKFTVEGEEPYKAYGNIAEEFNQYGISQVIQVVPTVLEASIATKKQEYSDFLGSVSLIEQLDYRLLSQAIKDFVHPIGGKYKKLSISDVRHDLEVLNGR